VFEKDIDDFFMIINSLNYENNNSSNQNEFENNKVVSKNDGFWDM
jgi:hypothetical protein